MAKGTSGRQNARRPNSMMLRRTLFLLVVCGIVAFLVLVAKLYQVMVVQHDYYENMAISQQVRETEIAASRGTIYDTNGKILAKSASVDTIFISPAEITKYDEDPVLIARSLSEILGVDYGKILEMTSDTKSWYKVVARKVESDVSDQVRAFKEENNIVGVKIEADTKRYYPYGSLAAHIIGFVGTDNSGLSGIESRYDDSLSGSKGRVVRATDRNGTDMLFVDYEDYYDASNGENVTLTLDATIQYYMEKHLQQAVEDYDVQNGAAAIAMDPNTGAILGMSSLGNFDLNDYQAVSEEAQAEIDAAESDEEAAELRSAAQQLQWRNKALSDTYEPGSTFKIITLAMALEEGLVDDNSTFYCGGSTNVLGRTDPLKCWKTGGHGSQTLTQAIQHSCNVALVQIGQKVGAQTFYKYAEAFGFLNLTENMDATLTAKTGIDLAGESGSIWWSQNTFYDTENLSQLASASFGQTFTITPLQLITAVSACVNGGNLMKPYVVKNVTDSSGKIVSANEPTVVRQVVSEQTSEKVREILEKVVGDPVDGTGKNAYVAGYRIGGKTGTSEKVAQDVAGGPKEYIVSFIGVAPADDPQIVILVLLDTPSNDCGVYISGGQMAAPTVGKMMADILPYMGVEPEYTDTEKTYMDKTVPNVTGLTVEQAKAALQEVGLNARVIGDGDKITQQLPGGSTVVASGSTILIYAGAEPSAEQEQMPDLTNLTYETARDRLAAYGLYLRTNSSITSTSQIISGQSIAEGTLVEHGTVVEVTLVTNDTSMIGRY
ncbi:MAG: penicillin-binding transpeptidase domain-containing protein [Oscillospiraceae bacterium]|nr:penicillin-binding transpeptidase domain-containing protein [Oscillospiraceae bacterium]